MESALGVGARADPSAAGAEAWHQSGELARLVAIYNAAEKQ